MKIILQILLVLAVLAISYYVGRKSCRFLASRNQRKLSAQVRNAPHYDYKLIYDKMCDLFEKKKIFLNPNLSVNDVARELLTNRSYLATAIRMYSKGNFCTFVNYYRIKYSIDKFMEDPSLRIVELASLCGFNSSAAYNIAFKALMNVAPGEWCRQYRMTRGKKD